MWFINQLITGGPHNVWIALAASSFKRSYTSLPIESPSPTRKTATEIISHLVQPRRVSGAGSKFKLSFPLIWQNTWKHSKYVNLIWKKNLKHLKTLKYVNFGFFQTARWAGVGGYHLWFTFWPICGTRQAGQHAARQCGDLGRSVVGHGQNFRGLWEIHGNTMELALGKLR